VFKFSDDFVKSQHEEVNASADVYVTKLHNLLGCIDMTSESGVSKAHGILNMIAQIQKIQQSLEDTEAKG
jgi:hypothetical protein